MIIVIQLAFLFLIVAVAYSIYHALFLGIYLHISTKKSELIEGLIDVISSLLALFSAFAIGFPSLGSPPDKIVNYSKDDTELFVNNNIHSWEIVSDSLEKRYKVIIPDTIEYDKTTTFYVNLKRNQDDKLLVKKYNRLKESYSDSLIIKKLPSIDISIPHIEDLNISKVSNDSINILNADMGMSWIYQVMPSNFGQYEIAVIAKVSFTSPVEVYKVYTFKKKIFVSGNFIQKIEYFLSKYWKTSLIVCIIVFLIINRLIPKSYKVKHYMEKGNKTNYWNSAFVSVVFIVLTFLLLVGFKYFEVSLWFFPLAVISAIFFITIVIAAGLRDNEKLSEEGLVKLFFMVFKRLPLINLFFKDESQSK